MIEKIYEVSCDYCGNCLNHYIGNKPTITKLKNDGFVCYRNLIFCNNNCYINYKNNHEKDN